MRKVLLVILDGFGIRNDKHGNAVKLADTPILDKLFTEYPNLLLDASGENVGLPKHQCGNSEVGHITIGSGRTVKQPLLIINEKIKNKEFFKSEEINTVMDHVLENDSSLHIVGLLSDGGVHSSINHFYAVLAYAKLKKVKKVYFHLFTDGRDTSPTKGKIFVQELLDKCDKLNLGEIGSLCGRYYAMDRDNKWERTKRAYDLLVYGVGNQFRNPFVCLEKHYKNGVTDEFINPSLFKEKSVIQDNDGIIFVNFRPERMKQLLDTFFVSDFKEFKTKNYKNLKMASIFNIYKKLSFEYQMQDINNTFGEYIDNLEFSQFRIAETEKFAHITKFFNGGQDLKLKHAKEILIPSPNVATYDLKPEMSAGIITEKLLQELEEEYDFMLVNFANTDMVGHTGNLKAAVDAVEIVDFCLGKVIEKALDNFYDVLITADHGNVEEMLDKNDNIITSHTNNKVPFIILDKEIKLKTEGSLKDIVPTILDIYEISKPKEMDGESLINKE